MTMRLSSVCHVSAMHAAIYHHLVLLILAYCLLIYGITVKPHPYRWLFFVPISTICITLYFHRVHQIETIPISMISLLSLDYLVLTNVQRELRKTGCSLHRDAQPDNKQVISDQVDISTRPFKERLVWSLQLLSDLRGIGWAHGARARNVNPPHRDSDSSRTQHGNEESTLTRRAFLLSQAKRLVLHFITFTAAITAIQRNDLFSADAPQFAEQTFLWRSWSLMLFVGIFAPLMSIWYNIIPDMLGVAAGLYDPEDCPPLFGNPLDSYSVGQFWSSTWHQTLRRSLLACTRFVTCRVFRMTRGRTLGRRILSLFTAFAISGALHSLQLSDARPMAFFLLQPVAILLEEAIGIYISPLLGTSRPQLPVALRRSCGYLWVWCWFVYSIGPFWDAMMQSRLWDIQL